MSLEEAKAFLGGQFCCFLFPKELIKQRGVKIDYVFPSSDMLRYFFKTLNATKCCAKQKRRITIRNCWRRGNCTCFLVMHTFSRADSRYYNAARDPE